MLEILDLKDCIVTADALNCQKAIAAKNLATLQAITMNLVKKITGKGSLKGKRYKASLALEHFLEAMRI